MISIFCQIQSAKWSAFEKKRQPIGFFSSQKCSTSHSEFGKKSISYCGVKGFIFTFHTLQPVQIESFIVLFFFVNPLALHSTVRPNRRCTAVANHESRTYYVGGGQVLAANYASRGS